jgi:acyl-CoA synthetase (NDP forming)/RimJ/RimL family protein N-acetyltransferase
VSEPLVRDVLLRDGSTLRLRSPRPDDYEAIKAFYDDLSPESRYMRFHGYGRTDGAAREYAEADGVDRVALIGVQGGRVVAAAGYDRLREPGAAEVAFAVADDFQGRGTATRLLEQLAAIAAERDIFRFDAEVLADNRAMLGVFKRAGFDVQRESAFGEVTVSLDIHPSEAVLARIDERDHRSAVASLRPILAPASVAVVGAGSDLGRAVLANLVGGGFAGIVTPVDRAGGVVGSMRAARGLGELAEPPELVVVAVPGEEEVLEAALDAAEHGARALLVLSAGFTDGGGEGRAREQELLETVRSAGLRLVGPNCLGVLNTDPSVRLNATFAGAQVPAGRLAICSQSGAIGISLLGHAAARRLGVSSFASLGNRADVSTNDLLELWEEDERTAAVMLYLETFGNPERFTRIAQRVSRRKPILAVKGGRVAPAAAAATAGGVGSHTAAALRGDAVVDALLHQAGVLRFHSGEELFNAAEFFEGQPLPRGRRMAIVSNSTGMATLAVDACDARGLLLSSGEVRNPCVLGIHAGPDDYAGAVRGLLESAGVDALMAYYVDLSSGDPAAVLAAISSAASAQPKPVVASVVGADGRLPAATSLSPTSSSSPPATPPSPHAASTPVAGSVPNFLFPEACAGVLARAADRRAWLSRPLGQRPAYDDLDPEGARALVAPWLGPGGDGWLPAAEAAALMATHGIPTVASHTCDDVEAAVAAAATVGGPIALKARFPPPGHAGDVDASLLGLEGEAAVRAGWRELERRVDAAGREWSGAVVQPLVSGGADVLVGAVSDPGLGTVMGIGLGGRQAGLGRTASFRLPPETDVEAGELIDASDSVSTQLDGFRGSAELDREALRELILRFALLLRAVPEIAEADLNPVRCRPHGCVTLDLRVRVQPRRPSERVKTW